MQAFCNSPKDRGNIVLISYFILGAGALLVWNAFITALDYFEYLYPHQHCSTLLPVVYNPANLFALIAILSIRKRIPERLLIRTGLIGYLVTLAVTIGVNRAHEWLPQGPSLIVTLTSAGCCGFLNGILQGALLAESSALPLVYTQAVIAGTAASGFLVALLRIISKVALEDADNALPLSALAYFAAAFLLTALCIFLHTWVIPSSDFVNWHIQHNLHVHFQETLSSECFTTPLLISDVRIDDGLHPPSSSLTSHSPFVSFAPRFSPHKTTPCIYASHPSHLSTPRMSVLGAVTPTFPASPTSSVPIPPICTSIAHEASTCIVPEALNRPTTPPYSAQVKSMDTCSHPADNFIFHRSSPATSIADTEDPSLCAPPLTAEPTLLLPPRLSRNSSLATNEHDPNYQTLVHRPSTSPRASRNVWTNGASARTTDDSAWSSVPHNFETDQLLDRLDRFCRPTQLHSQATHYHIDVSTLRRSYSAEIADESAALPMWPGAGHHPLLVSRADRPPIRNVKVLSGRSRRRSTNSHPCLSAELPSDSSILEAEQHDTSFVFKALGHSIHRADQSGHSLLATQCGEARDDEVDSLLHTPGQPVHPATQADLITAASRLLWPSLITLFLTYATTLALFPGYLTSETIRLSDNSDWVSVWLITVFTLCDLLSRTVPVPEFCRTPKFLVAGACIRVICVPAAIVLERVFMYTDVHRLLFTGVLAVGNGYLTTCAMLAGAESLTSSLTSIGGTMLVLAVACGLVAGSFAGVAVVAT